MKMKYKYFDKTGAGLHCNIRQHPVTGLAGRVSRKPV